MNRTRCVTSPRVASASPSASPALSASLAIAPATPSTRAPIRMAYAVARRLTRSRTVLVVVLAAVVATLLPHHVLQPANAHAPLTVVSCPYGWSLYMPPADSVGEVSTCVRVITDFPSSAAAVGASPCTEVFKQPGTPPPLSADGVTPWPYTRNAAPHGVAIRSAAANAFVRGLFADTDAAAAAGPGSDASAGVVVLGGKAGYGVLEWSDEADAEGETGAPYTNFADDVDWQLRSGVVAMRADGRWILIAAAPSTHPFACAFGATFDVLTTTTTMQPDSSHASSSSSSSATHAASSSTGGGSHGGSGSGVGPQPGSRRAHRPPVPQPAPACLPGWTPLPTSVDTSEGAPNTVCYSLVASASEVGGRLGKSFESARSHCAAVHPKATLASVMSREENAWLVSTLLAPLNITAPPTTTTGACVCESTAISSVTTTRTVFLGGSYMRDGSGGSLLGNWYADRYLFNASDFSASSPSSPAWPTTSNLYYANWATGEPTLAYGVTGVRPPIVCGCNTTDATSITAVSGGGVWVGLDPRSTQPFLCSYLNDGSVFPTPPPTTTADPSSSTLPPTPSPSELCLTGWSYLAQTNSCYRVYPTVDADPSAATDSDPVTSATMEESCEGALRGHVVATKVNRVHAIAVLSVAESKYIGSLFQLYLGNPLSSSRSNNAAANTGGRGAPPRPVSLSGASFLDDGASGFYISGVRVLDPSLVEALWAADEPANVKGCTAVDVEGMWYYVPCSSSTSDSIPPNNAVEVVAYTCQYAAADIDPKADLLPEPTTTTAPQPTSGPDWSSDSGASDNGVPLGQRVGSLSGAVHLVVAPGSTGIYTLEAPSNSSSAGSVVPAPSASVRGLHLYFAPLPIYYSYPVPAHGVDGTTLVPPAQTTPATSVNDLLSISRDGDFTGGSGSAGRLFAPCDGYKDQARIARVRSGTITVHHGNVSEVGYVCVSQDGRTYVPTAITYEVMETTVAGFMPAPARTQQQQQQAATSTSTWLPPLFCGSTTASTPSSSCTVQPMLAINAHATGTVQLALRQSSATSDSAASVDESTVVTTLSPEHDTTITHLRLSSAANCMDPNVPFQLLESEVTVQHVASARYTLPTAPLPPNMDNNSSSSASLSYSVISYQHAAVHAAHLATLSPIYNSSAEASVLARSQPPAEYYVCVSVQKTAASPANMTDVATTAAASRRLLALWGASATSMSSITSPAAVLSEGSTRTSSTAGDSSSSEAAAAAALVVTIAERFAARTSLSPSGTPVRLYTVVPGLKAHFVPPPVSVKGVWALPPRRLEQYTTAWASNSSSSADTRATQPRVTLVPAAATHNRTAHYLLRTRDGFSPANPSASLATASRSSNATAMPTMTTTTASTSHLHVPQYSAPILLFDSHDVRPGMLALFTQDPNGCNRHQPIPRADPTTAASTWPAHLDTMVPLSTVTLYVDDDDDGGDDTSGGSVGAKTSTMAYAQLNLNHTGLWGHHPTRTDDAAAMEQTWYVCIAYSAMSPFLPIRHPALAITVHRLRVDRFVMDASAAFTSSDAVAASEAADASTTHLNVNTGFAGMLWLHGVDVRLWSTTTLHSAQVAFSVALPSSGSADDTAAQCSNPNLFYAQRGLGVLTPDNRRLTRVMSTTTAATTAAVDEDVPAGVEARVGMVVPLGFFKQHSARRMQLCLSVPLPFAPATARAAATADLVPQQRHFVPLVSTTLDVRPIELLYVGRYSAIPASASATTTTTTSATVIRVAEGARDVVLPLTGYGIRPDMTMFLSPQPCMGASATSSNGDDGDAAVSNDLVDRQSLLNMSVVSLYDLPSSYWAVTEERSSSSTGAGHTHQPRVFVVLKHSDLLSKTAAARLFGPDTSATAGQRTPRHVCLYAPGTAQLVFPTAFQLVVDPPRVTSIRNLPSDAPLLTRALAQMPTSTINDTSTGSSSSISNATATVVYASTMDLLVEGFGLDDTNTWLMPAVDCSNTSSFLWRAPVQLSALPSSTTTTVHMEVAASGGTRHPLYAESTRYVDPQTSYSSWFLSLRQGETVRIGAGANVSSGTYVTRFQWCVRVVEGTGDADVGSSPFVATGLPYQLLLPVTDGFVLEGTRSRRAMLSSVLALPTQDAQKGRWFPVQLAGPLVDVAELVGSPLYLFLAPVSLTCTAVKNTYLMHGLYFFGNNSFSAVKGTGVLLPRWLTAPGDYQLCASTLYPTLASAEEGNEAALQFMSMGSLRVRLAEAVYAVFALNHTTTVTVEQGQEWTLPISGSLLTNRSLVRFQPTAAQCTQPMRASASGAGGAAMGTELPDIRVEDDFASFPLVGQDNDDDDGFMTDSHYVVLSQGLLRSLAAPASYVLCFQPQTHLEWRVAPAMSLHVHTHVRRPTSYRYFPDDGSEDVALLTALAPTKVALDWNTGEEHTVNIVGAAGRQVSLALWCFPTPSLSNQSNNSSSSSTSRQSTTVNGVTGVEEELVPCEDHRRVMFVRPLDNDEDPCFVDAEAVTEDVQRGPYVLDFGVLTLPYDLSVPPASAAKAQMIPNMTQPWIVCLETGPERWREPTSPMFQLQYTHAIATGFRVTIDDMSNTTAPFPAHKASVMATTTTTAEMDDATAMPLGGNTTLYLYAQDSSHAVFLNGYGIERGHRIRFGARCEETMTPPPSPGSPSTDQGGSGETTTDAAYTARVALVQGLVNTRLYTDPLPIEDDNGVFLIPSTHILEPEESSSTGASARPIPACLSTDEGVTYQRTTLSVRVLPSRLRVDTATTQRNLLAQVLRNTLLVPQHSRGSVDITKLLSTAAAASTNTTSLYPNSRSFLPTGTQVLLSASCGVNSHGIPIITIATPDVLTLTALQTSVTTTQRLRLCVRSADAAAAAAAAEQGNAGGSASGSSSGGSGDKENENDAGAPTMLFTATGVYYRVLAVRVDRVSMHAWTPSAAMREDLIDHVVLRRGALEDLLLSVLLTSSTSTNSSTTTTTTTADSTSDDDAMAQEDELLQRLEVSSSAVSLLSLTRFYVGRPCFRRDDATQPSTAAAPYISSYAGMQLTFTADRVAASPLPLTEPSPAATADSLNKTLVAALPSTSGGGVLNDVPHFSLEERGSICFSVDGGLHYLSVGIAHFTEDWAPTLRVTLDTEDDENDEDVAEEENDISSSSQARAVAAVATTSAMRVYAQSSTTRRLYDTRFVDPTAVPDMSSTDINTTASEVDAQRRVRGDLGQLTTAMLWNGFVGSDGFAMDGLLYLPAAGVPGGQPSPVPELLRFSLDNRHQNVSTNITLTVVPWSLKCYAAEGMHSVHVRRLDTGVLAPTAPGVCSAGVRDGVRVRVVPLEAAACTDTAAVEASYLFDLPTVQPAVWGAAVSAAQPSSFFSASSTPARAMQLSMGLRYVPDGVYALCLRQDLPFTSTLTPPREDGPASNSLFTVTYAATPLRLRVAHGFAIEAVSGAAMTTSNGTEDALVAIPQSANAVLRVTGTAVGVRDVPLLFAFAPVSAQAGPVAAATPANSGSSSSSSPSSWSLLGGCAAVPDAWDPVTGTSLVAAPAAASVGSQDGLLLTAPWYNAHDGVLRVPAAYTSHVEWDTSNTTSALPRDRSVGVATAGPYYTAPLRAYALCYSVDGGLTFRSAAESESDAGPGLAVVVVPPSITSLSCSRTSSVEASAQRLQWSAQAATATSVRVQHLYTTAAADAALTASGTGGVPLVEKFTQRTGSAETSYASRPPTYTYAWTRAFVGNGIGAASGRRLPDTASTSPGDVPTIAAAVALVRSSLYGGRCDGATSVAASFTTWEENTTSSAAWSISPANATSPLAAPVFVLSLQHGSVWSSADAAAVASWQAAQSPARRAEFTRMNPVLAQASWVAQTEALWARYAASTADGVSSSSSNGGGDGGHGTPGATPINGQSLLGWATSAAVAAARTNGESIVPCLSLDGTHFFTADVARAAAAAAVRSNGTSMAATPLAQQFFVISAAQGGDSSSNGNSTDTATTAPVSRMSPWPLYLRAAVPPSVSSNGTDPTAMMPLLWMREAAMVMQVLARPTAAALEDQPMRGHTAASLARFQAAMATALGVDASVVVAQLSLSGYTDAPTSLPDAAAANTSAQTLRTYALVLTVTADAVAYNATTEASALSPAPELLYRGVQLLRSNITGPALLATLMDDNMNTSSDTIASAPGVAAAPHAAVDVSSLTVNFTLRNGADLHAVNATMPAMLPTAPAQEVAWRRLFLDIPFATLVPEPVPDADDNDTTPKVKWWAIPLLLVLPAAMLYGTYHVYKKYLRRRQEAPVVENA